MAVVAQSEQSKIEERIRDSLAALGGAAFSDEDIIFEGKKLIVPEKMGLQDVVDFVEKRIAEEEQRTFYERTFMYRPMDGAYCTWKALTDHFGSVSHRSQTVQTMFGPKKAPPAMIDIPVGPNEIKQVPWGNFEIPFLPGLVLELGQRDDPEFGALFHIQGQGPKKYRFEVEGIFKLVARALEQHSIYRGQAVTGKEVPDFIDLSGIDPNKVTYSEEVMTQLSANIWSLVRYSQQHRDEGLPLKRAVLMHGPYGCIQGDAQIAINRAGKGFTISLKDLVRKFNGQETHGRYAWDPNIATYVQRENDGVIRLAHISAAWESGIKKTFTVTTETGRSLRATDEHPFLTDRGWLRLDQLCVGDRVHTRGTQKKEGRGPKITYQYTHVPLHPFKKANNVVATHRLVAEAEMNGIGFDDYVSRLRRGETVGLQFLDPDEHAVHHKDTDHLNNDSKNLQVMTHTAHHLEHSKKNMSNVLFAVESERIVSIEPFGEEMTYDIEVEGDPHNFLANGFVVHNTGKTLAAMLTAQECVRYGWTFLYARPGRDDLTFVMQTARLYQPACVFFEDMDLVADPDKSEGDDITQLLDLFDGLTAKNTEIQVILTTNHVDKIHKGMTRPGRLDAVIEIGALDGQGIERLITAVVPKEQLANGLDFTAIVEAMSDPETGEVDFMPAFVKEAADRTRRYAITRAHGDIEDLQLTTEDFVKAAQGLRPQLILMRDAKDIVARDPLSIVFRRDVEKSVDEVLRERIQPQLLVHEDQE